jgi:hypothetical protein
MHIRFIEMHFWRESEHVGAVNRARTPSRLTYFLETGIRSCMSLEATILTGSHGCGGTEQVDMHDPVFFNVALQRQCRGLQLQMAVSWDIHTVCDDIVTIYMCDCTRGHELVNGFIDHIYTHHSVRQVITALSLIPTFYKLPQHPLSFFSSLLWLHQPFPGNGF